MRRALGVAIPALAAAVLALALALAVGRRDLVHFSLGGRAFELLRPSALYLLVGAPLAFTALRFSLVDLTRRQQWLSASLRALLIALLALALARPSTVGQRSTVATVLLVDVSDSISDRQLDDARKLIDEARATRRGDDVLRVVSFGKHPRALDLPPDGTPLAADFLARHDGDTSDLSAAVQLAYGLFPPGTLARAVLISDGNETAGNLAAEAFAARDRGVRVSYASFPAEQDDEVLVRSLELPADVKVGAPFEVTAQVYASRAGRATVTLYRDEFVNPLDGRKELELRAGANTVRWRSEILQPGFTTFKAVLSTKLKDHFAANNQAVASVAVRGKPRVLYVEGEPQSSAYLTNALRKESIDVETRGPYGLPSSPRELARYDLVLLSDVPAMFVGPAQMAALESYVRDLGGGFIMAGGENSFGSGGYSGSRVESILPVRFDVEKKRDQPQLALVLAIDRSGSMTGEKIELAKDAAKATAEILGGEDLLGVIAFDSMAVPTVRLQRASNRTHIVQEISKLQAGGGTSFLPPLRMSFEWLDPTPAKRKHVILLTDGQANYEGILELVAEMAEHNITLTTVGVGAGADKTLLTKMAEDGGGRFYYTQDAQNIPKIFTKETTQVARSALVEEPIGLRVVKHAELLDGVGINDAPPLRGYVTTKPKPMSEVILESTLSEPILARWRVGLGQTAAFTSDVKNRWAAEWIRWPGYAKFWAHLVRSTMRHTPGTSGGATGASFDLHVDVDPPRARVAVDAIAADDRFLSGLDTTLQVIDPEHPQKPMELPLSPTAAGRYEGEFAIDRYGSFLLRAVLKQNGSEVAETAGTVSLPYPREYLALPPDEALLRRVAEITGGKAQARGAALFDAAGERVPFHRELWSWLLWAVAVLLLLDIAARRVRIFR
ncbi:MAG TPA: VWA domain-containing protein [Polyangia bacterium]|nr:VWA domain-containing protein [Polyangia bacterium]